MMTLRSAAPTGRKVLIRRSVTISILGAIACGEGEPDTHSGVPSSVAAIDLTIGAIEGPEEYLFGRISGLAADSLGRIYVADRQTSDIRMYGPDGVFQLRVARSGSGPGEVQSPCCLAVDADWRVWVRDSGNGRYNWYAISASGAIETGTIRMAHGDVWYGVAPSFGPDGHLVDVGHRTEDGTRTIVRFHRDSDGHVLQEEPIHPPPGDSLAEYEVTRETAAGTVTMYFYQPFGPYHLIAHSPKGGWAEAVSSRYSVRWIGSDGTPDVHIDWEWEGPVVSSAERDTARRQLEEEVRRIGATVGDLPFSIPDRKAPLRGLQFDQIGRLWVYLTRADGEAPRAHVYDHDKKLVTDITWPGSVSMTTSFLSDEFALAVQRDSLGVDHVVRLRW